MSAHIFPHFPVDIAVPAVTTSLLVLILGATAMGVTTISHVGQSIQARYRHHHAVLAAHTPALLRPFIAPAQMLVLAVIFVVLATTPSAYALINEHRRGLLHRDMVNYVASRDIALAAGLRARITPAYNDTCDVDGAAIIADHGADTLPLTGADDRGCTFYDHHGRTIAAITWHRAGDSKAGDSKAGDSKAGDSKAGDNNNARLRLLAIYAHITTDPRTVADAHTLYHPQATRLHEFLRTDRDLAREPMLRAVHERSDHHLLDHAQSLLTYHDGVYHTLALVAHGDTLAVIDLPQRNTRLGAALMNATSDYLLSR